MDRPHQPFFSENDLSYGIKIWTDLSSILSQITRLTDGRTDRRLIAIIGDRLLVLA